MYDYVVINEYLIVEGRISCIERSDFNLFEALLYYVI